MKKVIIWIAVLQVFLCSLFEAGIAVSEDLNLDLISNHVYGKLAIVTDLDSNEDFVSVTDWNGSVWQFYGIEDWNIGDFVDLVMYDNLTEDFIYDDIVISAHYERVDLVSQWGF